jgi:hypothetical protein
MFADVIEVPRAALPNVDTTTNSLKLLLPVRCGHPNELDQVVSSAQSSIGRAIAALTNAG